MQDQAETVMFVLETLRSKVLENQAVNKTQKMKVFGSHDIKPLLALLKVLRKRKMLRLTRRKKMLYRRVFQPS